MILELTDLRPNIFFASETTKSDGLKFISCCVGSHLQQTFSVSSEFYFSNELDEERGIGREYPESRSTITVGIVIRSSRVCNFANPDETTSRD